MIIIDVISIVTGIVTNNETLPKASCLNRFIAFEWGQKTWTESEVVPIKHREQLIVWVHPGVLVVDAVNSIKLGYNGLSVVAWRCAAIWFQSIWRRCEADPPRDMTLIHSAIRQWFMPRYDADRYGDMTLINTVIWRWFILRYDADLYDDMIPTYTTVRRYNTDLYDDMTPIHTAIWRWFIRRYDADLYDGMTLIFTTI